MKEDYKTTEKQESFQTTENQSSTWQNSPMEMVPNNEQQALSQTDEITETDEMAEVKEVKETNEVAEIVGFNEFDDPDEFDEIDGIDELDGLEEFDGTGELDATDDAGEIAETAAPMPPYSFIEFVKEELEENVFLAQSTRVIEETTLRGLREFQGAIPFDTLNHDFLAGFERFLFQKGLSPSTVHKYFRHLSKYINLAINKGHFSPLDNPFRNYKLQSYVSKCEYLTPEELAAFENIRLTPQQYRLQIALDMFLFACYTGLRFGDLRALSKDKLRVMNGYLWIDLIMIKTSEQIRIPVSFLFGKRPIRILRCYTSSESNEIFRDMSNTLVNRSLKELAVIAGLNRKRITFHAARHTFATALLCKGVSITTVQKLLGHKSIKTTQIYSKVIDTTIIKELQEAAFK
jgi:site-specific recombinase XerD